MVANFLAMVVTPLVMVVTSLVMVVTPLVMVVTSLVMVSTSWSKMSTFQVMVANCHWQSSGGHPRRLLHRNVQEQCKFKKMSQTNGLTDQRTNRLTWVGVRDTCVSKKKLGACPIFDMTSRNEICDFRSQH